QWGIPVLRFHFRWSDYELLQAKDMQETFKAIVEAAGGQYMTRTGIHGPYPFGIQPGGKIIHEVGTARMGFDPKASVLNGLCQAHDVKNLFVTDGAALVTNPDKNPTLTIMALSWRASEYLLAEAQKGNIYRQDFSPALLYEERTCLTNPSAAATSCALSPSPPPA